MESIDDLPMSYMSTEHEPATTTTTITNIETKIQMGDIIQTALRCNPQNETELYAQMLIAGVSHYLDILSSGTNKFISFGPTTGRVIRSLRGGKSIKRKRTSKKRRRISSLRKTRKHGVKRGGANVKIVAFFIIMFFIFVESLREYSHTEVKDRLKSAYDVIDLFDNLYGTCAANTLLFLKSIDLEKFVDLSRSIMSHKHGMTDPEMSNYFNKTISVESQWTSFVAPRKYFRSSNQRVQGFIENVRGILMNMRRVYGFQRDKDILTAMSYSTRGVMGHSVVVWLTKNNDVIIIDPQRYYVNDEISLYTSGPIGTGYMDEDNKLRLYPISDYIMENIDYSSLKKDHSILTAIHVEIEDSTGKNRWTRDNPEVINAISKIRNKKYELELAEERKKKLLDPHYISPL